MHDQIDQTIGPHVMVQIHGLARCQHRIFDQVHSLGRVTITIAELHVVSHERHAFAEFHRGLGRLLEQQGIAVGDIELSAHLHRVGLDALSRLQRLSDLGASIVRQLTLLDQAHRRGKIGSDEQFASAEVLLDIAA